MATFPSKVNYATGDILTATNMNDVGGAINLLDGAQFAAGKNKFINGDFGIDQRQTSSTTSNGAYIFDRWSTVLSGGTVTYSKQTFTPGAAPVAGYEATNYLRAISSGQATGNYAAFSQNIEDVRTFAGQTVTVSFWAKAGTGTPKVGVRVRQFFGTGGSTAVATIATAQTITTSWARYSFTVAVPSISGKTIGTENTTALSLQIIFSDDTTFSSGVGIQNGTFEFWGLQIEAAQTASPFQTATGTKQGELAACQRYYYRQGGDASIQSFATGQAILTTVAFADVKHPVTMRVAPTAVDSSAAATLGLVVRGASVTALNATPTIDAASKDITSLRCAVASGLTANQAYSFVSNSSTAAYVGLSAEL